MSKVLQYIYGAVGVALLGLLGAATWDLVASHKALVSMADTMDTVNRPCGVVGKPCGTLADIAKTLGTVRVTTGEIEIAADHENKRIAVLDAQEAQLAANSNSVLLNASLALGEFRHTLTTADTVVAGLQAPIDGLTTDTQKLGAAADSVTTLVSNSDIPSILDNAKQMSASGVTVGASIASSSVDFKNKFHAVLYPAPCTGNMCWLKALVPVFKAAAPASETLYYLYDTFHKVIP